MWFKVRILCVLVLSLLLVLTAACRQPQTVPHNDGAEKEIRSPSPTLGFSPSAEEKVTPTPVPLSPSPTFSPPPAAEEKVTPSSVLLGSIEARARYDGVVIIGRTSSASVVEVPPQGGQAGGVYVDWLVEVEQVFKYSLGLNPQRVSVRVIREFIEPNGFRFPAKVEGLAVDQRYLLILNQFTISAPGWGAFWIEDGIVHSPWWIIPSEEVPLQDAIARIERVVK